MHLRLRHGALHLSLEIAPEGGHQRVHVDGREYLVQAQYVDEDTMLLEVDGIRHTVHLGRRGRERFVAVGGESHHFAPEAQDGGHELTTVLEPDVRAPMPGKVLQVLVAVGAVVEAGDGLLIVEAMKMENRLQAPAGGVVEDVRVEAGQMVDGGQVLVVLRYS